MLPPGPRRRGRRPTTRPWPSPTTSGAPTSSRRRCAGTWRRPRISTRPRATCAPRTCASSVLVSSDPGRHARVDPSRPRSSASTSINIHHVGQEQDRSSTPSANTSCRRCGRGPTQRGIVRRVERIGDADSASDLWWKNAIVYCLDVETFQDSDGDGHRRLRRPDRAHRLPRRLGVTCLWLMPFFPSADRDDGYDITDFYGVDPRLGTLGDFTELMQVARDRGHPRDRRPRREPHVRPAPVVPAAPRQSRVPVPRLLRLAGRDARRQPGEQSSSPTRRTRTGRTTRDAGQYYLHRFYRHQPDLNVANPRSATRSQKVVGFWLEQGLSGFRVDAVPFLIELEGIGEAME